MKKLNITKDKFTESKYFQTKYGKLEYVSESGKLYKTSKGHVLKFVNESNCPFTHNKFYVGDMVMVRAFKEVGKVIDYTEKTRSHRGYTVRFDDGSTRDCDESMLSFAPMNESESIGEELKVKAMAAAKMLGVIAFLGDEELDKKYELFSRQKNIRAAKMAAAIKDIKAYRAAANKLKDERIGGKFVGSDEEYSESIGDDYEMDDDEMVKICEKYHDRIMDGYDALVQFSEEIEYYAPTCQYEIEDAINNLNIVTRWVHMGANDQFYT